MRQGGKRWARREIVSRFPAHYKTYVECFGGAGWVLFHKPPPRKNQLEVYNDADGNLVNLFRMARERPFGLLKELSFLRLNSREEFFYLRQLLNKQDFTNHYLQSELEAAREMLSDAEFREVRRMMMADAKNHDLRRAAAFFQILRHSYGAGTTSFNCQPCDLLSFGHLIWKAHHRLKNTVIECQDYKIVLPHYDRPDTVFYLDPPYVEAEYCYAAIFTLEDHLMLAEILHKIKGKFLLSYNDHPLVRELYKDCYIIELERPDSLALAANPGQVYKELLIANYDLHDTAAEAQLSLF